MSRVGTRKNRVQSLMSDSLSDKLDGYAHKEVHEAVYSPVKSTKLDFLNTVEEAIGEEEVSSRKKKRGKALKTTLFALMVFVFILALGGLGYLAYTLLP